MYLTCASNPAVIARAHPRIGLMAQPASGYALQIGRYPKFAIDNGAFGGRFDEDKWLRFTDRVVPDHYDRLLFVVAPDRFDPTDLDGNHKATLHLWDRYAEEILERGLPAAFVCQNGCTPDDIPVEAAAVFIGGDTRWKLSEQAWACVAAAKAHGQWAHMGRVNSFERFKACDISGADSADGTFLKYGSDILLPQLVSWLDRTDAQRPLPMFGGAA